jgi:hypothetical protein
LKKYQHECDTRGKRRIQKQSSISFSAIHVSVVYLVGTCERNPYTHTYQISDHRDHVILFHHPKPRGSEHRCHGVWDME